MTDIEPVVLEHGGKAMTDSRHVAEAINKRHEQVLRAIRNIIKTDPEAAPNFGGAKPSGAQDKLRDCFEMDQTGFTLLVMGFNNSVKAAAWKRRYVKAFEATKATAALEARLDKLERFLRAPVS